jgi:CRISPR system Cascade subunit CasE
MFLTRFEINRARRGSRTLLSSRQAMHAAVLAGFRSGTEQPDEKGRLLWRVDQDAHRVLLFIVSRQKPDLTHLAEQAGWPTSPVWETREYQPLLDSLRAGNQWAFRLAANPTRSGRKDATSEQTQRFGHLTARQQQDWLLARCEKHGFTIPIGNGGEPALEVRRREVVRFNRQGKTVTLSTAVLDGQLEIVDANAFRHILTHGLGPAKGYGCGLLTLAKGGR